MNATGTHSFIYKGNEYPFDIEIFNVFSKFFTSQQIDVEENTSIKLLDDNEEDLNITKDVINNFVDFCQNQHITITKENVTPLHNLAKKYMVKRLIDATEKFILDNKKENVVQYLLINLKQKDFNSQELEDIISKDITDFIKDDKLLDLPFPILYRIVTKYEQKFLSNNNNSALPPEFIEFLFKCLNKFGQEASTLFEYINTAEASKIVNRLLNEYSDIFDFHFISENCIRTIYDVQNEIIKKEENIKNQQLQDKQEFEKIKLQNDDLKEEIQKLKLLIEENNREKDEKINQMQENLKNIQQQIDAIKRQQQETSLQIEQTKSQQNDKNNQINQQQQELKSQIEQLNQQQNEKIQQNQTQFNEQIANITQIQIETKNEIQQIKNQQNDKNNQINQQQQEIKSQLEQINQQQNDKNNQNNQQQQEIKSQVEQISQQQNDKNNQIDEHFQQQQTEFTNQLNLLRQQITQLTDQVTQQNGLINQLNNELNELKRFPISRNFDGESSPRGIISFLNDKVTLNAGGKHHPNRPLSNIKNYNDNFFYNYNSYNPLSESDSFIEFDFGPTKKINLFSYFIKSNSYDESFYHPKSWRIEGSNDKMAWIRLDQRLNDLNLRGKSKCHCFQCQESNTENQKFRYIRYVQLDSWWKDRPYYVCISYFELYGDIYNFE